MKKRLLWSIAVVVLGVLTGVARAADRSDPSVLRVALLPDENASALIKKNEGLKKYLEQATGKSVELVVTTDYSSMIEAMRRGHIELAYFGPLSYVLAKQRCDIQPFAVQMEKGNGSPERECAGRRPQPTDPGAAAGKGVIKKEKIRVLSVSNPYPNYPWTMQSYLKPELQKKIRDAFLNLKDPEIMHNLKADGFGPAADKDYDVIRELAKILRIDPAKI